MIRIQSNILSVRKTLQSMLIDLADVDKVMNRATLDSFASIKQRIQQRGEKSDGTPIGKYAGAKGKSTSIGTYAAYRESLGRQTAYVDLTLTGDMMNRGFSVIKIDESTIAIGFLNSSSARKAAKMENKYGKIFENTHDEIDFFIDSVVDDVNRILNA